MKGHIGKDMIFEDQEDSMMREMKRMGADYVCFCVFGVQVDGARGEKGQKGEPAVIEPVSITI